MPLHALLQIEIAGPSPRVARPVSLRPIRVYYIDLGDMTSVRRLPPQTEGGPVTSLSVEEREAFRDSLARLLAARNAETDVRRLMETEAGYDRDLWAAIADLGVT